MHLHDDLLDDYSRQAIDARVHELGAFGRRLAAIDPSGLTVVEKIQRPLLEDDVRARLFELEDVRTWERSPQLYAELLSTSLASQVLFPYAPIAERARRVVSKLRQAPRLLQAARENIKEPPGLFVKIGLETLRGALRFVEEDLPRGLADLDDLRLLSDLADATGEAADALRAYIDHLEREVGPRARGAFRLGRERFERKLRLEEGMTTSSDKLLEIAMRELRDTQEAFRRAAGRLDGGDPHEAWQKLRPTIRPSAPSSRPPASRWPSCSSSSARRDLVSVPEGEAVVVAGSPRFYRWTFASMWTPGPFEARAMRADYYLTDVDASWPAERKEEHLRDFDYGALWSILDARGLPRALPPLPAPAPRDLEAPQVGPLRLGLVRRRVGALLRANGRRRRVPARRPHRAPGPAGRGVDPPVPVRRGHPPAYRRHVGRAGHALLPRRGVHGGAERPARGRTGGVRPDRTWSTRRAS